MDPEFIQASVALSSDNLVLFAPHSYSLSLLRTTFGLASKDPADPSLLGLPLETRKKKNMTVTLLYFEFYLFVEFVVVVVVIVFVVGCCCVVVVVVV